MAKQLPQLGNVNAYVRTLAFIPGIGSTFYFDGTTVDFVNQAINNGAIVGDKIQIVYGPRDMVDYVLYENPSDKRTGGFWAERIDWLKNWKEKGIDPNHSAYKYL
jgi:hypothetical protein